MEGITIYPQGYQYYRPGYGGYQPGAQSWGQAGYQQAAYGYQPQYYQQQYQQPQYYQQQYQQPQYYQQQYYPPQYQQPRAPPFRQAQYNPYEQPSPFGYTPPYPPWWGAFGRGTAITAAAIIFIVFGAIWAAYSIIALVGSLLGTSLLGIPLIGSLVTIATWILATVGIGLLIPSVLSLVAGYLLWKSRRSGGILGIILAGALIAVNATTLLLGVLWVMVVGVIGVVIFVLAIVLIAVGWKYLR